MKETFNLTRSELEAIQEALTLASKLDEYRQLQKPEPSLGWKEDDTITLARTIVRNLLEPNRVIEEHKLHAPDFIMDPADFMKRAEEVFDMGKPVLTEHKPIAEGTFAEEDQARAATLKELAKKLEVKE